MSKNPVSLKGTEKVVVIRDEADAIIDNLKSELNALQSQLTHYREAGGGPPEEGGETTSSVPSARAYDASLTPHIAARMEIPAKELTRRLELLIGQIDDRQLKEELEQCRDTASFMHDTFRQIGEKHQRLTDSLTALPQDMDAEAFCKHLEESLHERNLMVPLTKGLGLPRRVSLSPQTVITILATLTELAADIFSLPSKLIVAGGDGAGESLLLRIECGETLEMRGEEEPLSAMVIRSGIRSKSVVELLYVEKIIEMRGGSLKFMERDGKAGGFEVRLPLAMAD